MIFWGTFFPLIAEAATGRQRNIGPPVYEAFVVPLALLLVLAAGIGPLIAWRRATAANLRRNLARPRGRRRSPCSCVLIALGQTRSVTALIMFTLAGFVFGGVVQDLWRGTRARRAVSGEPVPLALVSLVRRNRRRYGGYLAHLGIITLFVGVAASSSFKDVQDVALNPGQTAKVGGYEFTYVKPIAELHAAPNGRLERIAFGAQLSVRKDGGAAEPLRTSKDYFPVQDPSLGPVSRFFDGESTTEVGLDASLHNDIWAAVAPDTVEAARPDRRGRPAVRQGRRRPDRRAVERVPRARAARADRPLHGEPAARALPPRGQPDGDLDLDRRR